MRHVFLVCALLLTALPAGAVALAEVPFDQQINIGLGDAIYAPYFDELTFRSDEPEGYCRQTMIVGGGAGGYYYGPYVDFVKAGIGAIDISDPATVLEVYCRYFQGGENTNPYADAPIFYRVYTYDEANVNYLGHREYGIFYGPTGETWYPTWTYKTFALNDSGLWPYPQAGLFDPTKVARMRFWGTDWSGMGQDFIDVKKLKITVIPEPGSALALLAGLGALVPFVRRKR